MDERAAKRTVVSGDVTLATLEAGDASMPMIVLVHGYPDTKELWLPVIERLAGEFHVIAYDVRGAGASSAPHGPRAYGFDQLAGDFAAVCDQFAAGRRVHLVGHDWGGIQGWEFLASPHARDRIASFTSIAGPALHHVVSAQREPLRRARLLEAARRTRRSWYVVPLLLPGGPTVAWRGLLSAPRWRWLLANIERLAVDEHFPAPTLAHDGLHGSNLYRRNVPPRLLRGQSSQAPQVPVQLIVPAGDRFISGSYYDGAERAAPGLRRRTLPGSHWAPRSRPDLVSRWIAEFAREAEAGPVAPSPRWRRGAGTAQLAGRLALVTGAGSGIGRATAEALAAYGARVVLVDRDAGALEAATASIPDSRAERCDVSDPVQMQRLGDRVLGTDGVPDVVVNNAGIGIAGPFLDTGVAEWRRIVDINLLGVVEGCRLFGRAMAERGLGGQLVITASAAGFMPSRSLPAYCATKAAVLMLSECIRGELAPYGVGVTAVCPGFVATNITRATAYMGRAANDQDRLRELVTRAYERRNFTPGQVAAEIIEAIGADRPVAVVTPEAKLMRALSRFAPGLTRRIAARELLPA